jgi:hypothetical protein
LSFELKQLGKFHNFNTRSLVETKPTTSFLPYNQQLKTQNTKLITGFQTLPRSFQPGSTKTIHASPVGPGTENTAIAAEPCMLRKDAP